MAELLQVRNLSKSFRAGSIWNFSGVKKIRAVQDVSFDINEGEVFGLVGESGCGKTTIGRLIIRLEDADQGEVLFEGQNVLNFDRSELSEYRKKAQIVFQNPFSSLNPRRSVFDSLSEGYSVYRIGNKKERREWLSEILLEVGLDPEYLDRFPHQFSGGQRQRLVIARALTLKPKFIMADEPVSALDVSIQAQTLNLMRKLQHEFGFSMLFISHDLRVIYQMSDTIGVMYMGKMVERAPKRELFENPLHPYTKALFASAPRLGENNTRADELIEGEVWDKVPPENGCIFYYRCKARKECCLTTRQALVDRGNGHLVACSIF
ncbi:MAG: ABC transporter ATP-binding protein [Flexilinea sp.]